MTKLQALMFVLFSLSSACTTYTVEHTTLPAPSTLQPSVETTQETPHLCIGEDTPLLSHEQEDVIWEQTLRRHMFSYTHRLTDPVHDLDQATQIIHVLRSESQRDACHAIFWISNYTNLSCAEQTTPVRDTMRCYLPRLIRLCGPATTEYPTERDRRRLRLLLHTSDCHVKYERRLDS